MRRLIGLILVSALTLGLAAPAAYAGDSATNVALGLASFAVFSQFVGPLLYPAPATPVYVYQLPPQQVIVVQPPAQEIVVVPGTPVYYYGHGGPPPWAGRWKKHWRGEDDD